METGPHGDDTAPCGPVVLARGRKHTVVFLTIELSAVDAGKLRAFAEHNLTCYKCCRTKTLSARTPICIKGMILAAQASAILRRRCNWTVDPRHIGTER